MHDKIKTLRKNRNLSHVDLAKKLGCHFSNINKIEKGIIIPSKNEIQMLADIFEVSFDDLVRITRNEALNELLKYANPDTTKWNTYFELSQAGKYLPPSLEGASMQHYDLERVNFHNINLRNSDFREAEFMKANLEGANFENATLYKAFFVHSNLKGANFSHADLTEANLRGADLRGTNFNGADLRGTNLTNANIDETNFTNAKYNIETPDDIYSSPTIFPDGFDPDENGLIRAKWQNWRPKPRNIMHGESFFCAKCGNIIEAEEDGAEIYCDECGATHDELEYYGILPDDI